MTTNTQRGFLLGLAAKGFLKGETRGKFMHAQILKPIKCKVVISVRNEQAQ